MVSFSPSVQSAVDKYAKALKGVRGLFDLYPSPRPVGAPASRYRPLPSAIVQGVTAAFESFAEELIVTTLVQQGATWAHVAANANLTNPTLSTLAKLMSHACGIVVQPAHAWSLKIWRQSSGHGTGWSRTSSRSWEDIQKDSDGWMQVRHCLTHGLVTGATPAKWPGPVTRAAVANQQSIARASDVLAQRSAGRSALVLYSATNACLVYSHGGGVIAASAAASLGESINTSELLLFEDI